MFVYHVEVDSLTYVSWNWLSSHLYTPTHPHTPHMAHINLKTNEGGMVHIYTTHIHRARTHTERERETHTHTHTHTMQR